MTSDMTKFTKRMQTKMQEVEGRLEALQATADKQTKNAGDAFSKHIDSLADGAHKAKDTLDKANADMAAWAEDAEKTVAGWRTTLNAKMLQGRADRSERYAEAALIVALSNVDHAEKAMLSATVARAEAEAAHQPS